MKKMNKKFLILNLLFITFLLAGCDILDIFGEHGTCYNYKDAIYLIDTDGNNLTKVIDIGHTVDTYNSSEANLPGASIQFTSDGNKLICGVDNKLFLVNINGSDSTLLTDTLIVWGQPSISLTEPKIVFSAYKDIFTVNLDATGLTNLTNTSEATERYPCFSPNGYEIIFSTSIYSWSRNYYINRLNINSGKLDTLAANNEYPYKHLAFSPDGTKIYFNAYINNTKWSNVIYVMNSDGTYQLQLYEDINIADYLSISPDGSKIVYNDYHNLYVMNSDGSGITQIETAIKPRNSHISHNGAKKIVYSIYSITGDIYIIDINGSNERKIHRGFKPTFSPDDSKIAFSGSYLYETVNY